MASKTSNLKLNTWFESDVVNFEEVNENFDIIDKLVSCIESGTKNSYYSIDNVNYNTTWHYKKFSDNTIELYTKIETETMKCDSGSVAPYKSGNIQVYFPFELKEVTNLSLELNSETIGWIHNRTNKTVKDYVVFNVLSMTVEQTANYKGIFISLKGEV